MSSINPDPLNYVFIAPMPGKPDTQSEWKPGEQRNRIKQSPQPPNLCFLYALKIIRDNERVGKMPTTVKQVSDRKFEKSISDFFRKTLPSIEIIDSENIKNIDLIENFILSLSTEERLDETLQFYHIDKNTKNLNLYAIYRGLLQEILLENFDFSYASWSKNSPIEVLIKSLKDNGPHIVCGPFGAGELNTAPERVRNAKNEEALIEKRPLFTRKATGSNEQSRSHAIVLVGAEIRQIKQQSHGYVYYIDPRDGSDTSYESQKIYVMSYEKLLKNLVALNGDDDPEQLTNNYKVAAYLKHTHPAES